GKQDIESGRTTLKADGSCGGTRSVWARMESIGMILIGTWFSSLGLWGGMTKPRGGSPGFWGSPTMVRCLGLWGGMTTLPSGRGLAEEHGSSTTSLMMGRLARPRELVSWSRTNRLEIAVSVFCLAESAAVSGGAGVTAG